MLEGGRTTAFSLLNPKNDKRLTGNEKYSVLGQLLSPKDASEIVRRMKGLSRYWNCLEKAEIVTQVISGGEIVMGECLVWSGDMESSYGFYWNPPYEFHAWVSVGRNLIIDAALPGVIEKGLATRDHIGPCVTQRAPFILAGEPPNWVQYRAVQVVRRARGGWLALKSFL